MAKGMFVPAELMILIAIVLLYQTCRAKDSHDCAPSSFGDIHNISSPFQLKGDPTNCGYPSYNLSCENNQTVLYLFAGKYYVREINYGDHTIRVADPAGIEKDSHSFTPRYFLNHYNFSSEDPYDIPDATEEGVVFLKCENPMNAPYYWDISSCFNDEAYSSNSTLSYFKGYRYVGAGSDAKTTDLGNLRRVEQISLTSWPSEYNDS
ncbi:uncharacterized protein LOC121257840 [Juglans microcarpa x Juglans regia]|uniref:uncharacterized protein LOC121257840 n=1 Tax=Juglans microcarpa x Juglans regia TaxID=2249226 RepID=UPI001B7ECB4F|nr:uncharacterized protein LOC121257840 [Juglans microcarpa x Juglans regia]